MAADRDRQAAEWTIRSGGRPTVIRGNGTKREVIERIEELPREKFRLVTVDFWNKVGNSNVTDESLAQLDGLEHLEGLILDRTSVTDAAMKRIRQMKTLTLLNLAKTQVTDAGYRELRGLIGLTNLGLDTTKITSDGLASVGELTNLASIALGGCHGVDDRGMPYLGKLTKLRSLAMSGVSVTDAGLAQLKPLVELDFLVISGPNLTDRAVETITGFTKLNQLVIGRSQIGDEGLRMLATAKSLRKLALEQTRATAAGVTTLQAALPNCKIDYRPAADLASAPPTAAPVPTDPAVERRAADWALSLGAKLLVQARQGTPIEVAQIEQLPNSPFTVRDIERANRRPIARHASWPECYRAIGPGWNGNH
jgi:hypothetical protein